MAIDRNDKTSTSSRPVHGPRTWSSAKSATNKFIKLAVTTLWTVAALVILAAVVQGIWDRRTSIDPISVPKAFAESGYTPEVASQRLRDAMRDYTKLANSSMRSPAIALHG